MANSGKDINFGADLLPTESGVYNLGSASSKWNVIYGNRVDATSLVHNSDGADSFELWAGTNANTGYAEINFSDYHSEFDETMVTLDNHAETLIFNGKAQALTTSAGSSTNPVYFANGVPVNTSYTFSNAALGTGTTTIPTSKAVSNAIADVGVGGRNLLTGTESGEGWLSTYLADSSGEPYNASAEQPTASTATDTCTAYYIAVSPSTQYTLSVNETFSIDSFGRVCCYDSSKAYLGMAIDYICPSSATSWTFTTPASAAYVRVSALAVLQHKWKLERGSRATDWTPAPEDVLEQVAINRERTICNNDTYQTFARGLINAMDYQGSLAASTGQLIFTASLTQPTGQYKGDIWLDMNWGSARWWDGSEWCAFWSRSENIQTWPGYNMDQALPWEEGSLKVFTKQPTPPYEVGDLFFSEVNRDILRCIKARESGDYSVDDWSFIVDGNSATSQLVRALDTGEEILQRTVADLKTKINGCVPTTLYSSTSGTQSTVTLSDYASGYRYLDIYYTPGSGNSATCPERSTRVICPTSTTVNKYVVLDTGYTASSQYIQWKHETVRIYGKYIYRVDAGYVNANKNANSLSCGSGGGNVYITRVTGIK